jgi:hypothetical protein
MAMILSVSVVRPSPDFEIAEAALPCLQEG